MMKLALGFALVFALSGTALAENGVPAGSKLRLAQAANACVAGCSSQNASCKRVCPATFSDPCLSACDSQMHTCVQGCQNK